MPGVAVGSRWATRRIDRGGWDAVTVADDGGGAGPHSRAFMGKAMCEALGASGVHWHKDGEGLQARGYLMLTGGYFMLIGGYIKYPREQHHYANIQ